MQAPTRRQGKAPRPPDWPRKAPCKHHGWGKGAGLLRILLLSMRSSTQTGEIVGLDLLRSALRASPATAWGLRGHKLHCGGCDVDLRHATIVVGRPLSAAARFDAEPKGFRVKRGQGRHFRDRSSRTCRCLTTSIHQTTLRTTLHFVVTEEFGWGLPMPQTHTQLPPGALLRPDEVKKPY